MFKCISYLILGLFISTSLQAAITITPADIQQDAEGFYYLYELTYGDLIRGSTKFEDDASNISNITVHKTPLAIPPATPEPRWVCATAGESTASFSYVFDFSEISLNAYDAAITSVEIRDKLLAGNNKGLSEDSVITSKWIVVGTSWHTMNSVSSPSTMIPETSVQSHTLTFSATQSIQVFYYQVEFECFDKDGFDENLNQWNHLSDSDSDHFYVIIRLKEDIFSGGSGTEEDPYLISTPEDLIYLGQHPEFYDANFLVINDIDMAGHSFTEAVIAPDTNSNDSDFNGTRFTGYFNGDDYAIQHLLIEATTPPAWFLGLFGGCREASLLNVRLEDVIINDPNSAVVGALAGRIEGGKMLSCKLVETEPNACMIYGGTIVGGLAGDIIGCCVENCSSSGTVIGIFPAFPIFPTGGLVGQILLENEQYSGNVLSCHSNALVYGSVYSTGGLIGLSYTELGGKITNCSYSGVVTGIMETGGLIGDCGTSIEKCFSTGTVKGVSGSEDVGGLVGKLFDTAEISESYSEAYIECDGWYNTGGLVGSIDAGSVLSSCYFSGDISSEGYGIGAIAGHNSGVVMDCYSVGEIVCPSFCSQVGGLVGDNLGSIVNSYSVSSIDCQDTFSAVGGIIGYSNTSDGSPSYAACFWDIQATGITNGVGSPNPDPVGIYGRYTFTMMNQQLYTQFFWDFVGEDFNGYDDSWRMCANGITYPKLWWEFVDADLACPDGVNLTDYSVLAKNWLTDEEDLLWYENADINSDGIIDVSDLLAMCENWLVGVD